MNKAVRLHKKQDKQIVRLALQKGAITPDEFKGLYWAAYSKYKGPPRKRKRRGVKYRTTRYYTELYYATEDYWGEGDEHSIVYTILQGFIWQDAEYDDATGRLTGPYTGINRGGLIKLLRKMPRVYHKQISFSHCRDNC